MDRNVRSRRGEVDIVAGRGDEIIFVEVKCWSALGEADLEYAIGAVKRRRITAAARWYLARRGGMPDARVRFDVILVPEGQGGIRHIEGAFDTPGDTWYA